MLDQAQTGPPIPLPPTPRQLHYARRLAVRNQVLLPQEVQQDRRGLSDWIRHQSALAPLRSTAPSSKQVAYAEQLARRRRRDIPDECFRSRDLMSRWIDRNQH